jgi:hypothetical protein
MALYPTQKATWDALQREVDPAKKTACGRPGVNGGYFDPLTKFGVNCFGFKPKGDFKGPAPLPGVDKTAFDAMVKKFKDMLKSMTVTPFSRQDWSGYSAGNYGKQFAQDLGKLTEKFTEHVENQFSETTGATNSAYTAAPYGLVGAAGPKGDTGPAGPMGPKGDMGAMGPMSTVPGPIGPAGAASTVPGPAGPRGATGPAGPQGPQGLAGATAAKGDRGEKGEKGDKGDVGPAGLTGAAGAAGPKGDKGDVGPAGVAGAAAPVPSDLKVSTLGIGDYKLQQSNDGQLIMSRNGKGMINFNVNPATSRSFVYANSLGRDAGWV